MGCGRWSLACAFLALAAAGCGGNDSSGADVVASAADRTLDKQSGRFATTLEPSVWVVSGGRGVFSVRDKAVNVTMACCPGPSDAPTVLEFRMLYPVGYAGYEEEGDSSPGAIFPSMTVRHWVKVDLERPLAVQLSNLEPAFRTVITHLPVGGLALLRGSTDVRKLDAERIDGTRTTRYRVTVDPDRASAKATPQEQAVLRLAQQDGPAQAEMEVWIGGDGLVRRMRQGVGGGGTVTTTFSDLGARYRVEAPPADKTTAASSGESGSAQGHSG